MILDLGAVSTVCSKTLKLCPSVVIPSLQQAVAPNAEKFSDLKAQQKKQWLEDLGMLLFKQL